MEVQTEFSVASQSAGQTRTQNDQDLQRDQDLLFLVKMFRWLGITFGDVPEHIGTRCSLKPLEQQRQPGPKRTWWPLWSLAYAITIIGSIFWFLFFAKISESSYHKFSRQMAHTKPILRILVSSVTYVYLVNNLFGFVHFSSMGGAQRLIQHLSTLPSIDDGPRTVENSGTNPSGSDSGVSCTVLARLILVIQFFNLLGLIYGVISYADTRTLAKHLEYFIYYCIRRSIQNLASAAIYFQLTIFIYIVRVYRNRLCQVQTEFDQLDHNELVRVRTFILELEHHFRETERQLQWPILFSICSCTIILVGLLCLLLITVSSASFGGYMGFVFLLTTDSIVTCSVVIFYGNRVNRQYRELLQHIRLRTQLWDLHSLLQFQRLLLDCSHFRQFRLSLYQVVPLNQTLLISLATFILNYIVLLIQTDNTRSSMNQDGNGPPNVTRITS